MTGASLEVEPCASVQGMPGLRTPAFTGTFGLDDTGPENTKGSSGVSATAGSRDTGLPSISSLIQLSS